MTPPQSNNPFRSSMLPSSSSSTSLDPPSPDSLSPPLQKTPSTSTTIYEDQDRPSSDITTSHTIAASMESLPTLARPIKDQLDKEIVITIHPTTADSSQLQEPQPCLKQPGRPSMQVPRCSMQVEECGMWPARRMIQKQQRDKKRMWIWIKIGIAILILAAAVAVGLGISKAVKDGRQPKA
ncbi:hypothetical protein FPQ18DRAFT_91558 [Pyronema domesticum]|uniref:Uncharacterized protein n=1 Tax=Pyronema omphalodes (strain CBS 100304) TaxID=1076935 RepID=U4LQN9_PYROM|nr:hypothetical protein FPQ18DRAFT_91558 [Pyronema domesticum]CCX34496.1 Similar to hypothetical protein [Tuber melanosporum Mel28]; acc. no. XP_002839351 [Pyronema omphalodes CBS 100304]